jgi:hypothetical protein
MGRKCNEKWLKKSPAPWGRVWVVWFGVHFRFSPLQQRRKIVKKAKKIRLAFPK